MDVALLGTGRIRSATTECEHLQLHRVDMVRRHRHAESVPSRCPSYGLDSEQVQREGFRFCLHLWSASKPKYKGVVDVV